MKKKVFADQAPEEVTDCRLCVNYDGETCAHWYIFNSGGEAPTDPDFDPERVMRPRVAFPLHFGVENYFCADFEPLGGF